MHCDSLTGVLRLGMPVEGYGSRLATSPVFGLRILIGSMHPANASRLCGPISIAHVVAQYLFVPGAMSEVGKNRFSDAPLKHLHISALRRAGAPYWLFFVKPLA